MMMVAVLGLDVPLAQADDLKWGAKLSQAQQFYGNRQFSEAILAAEEALHMAEKQVGREAPELIDILSFLGTLYSTKASFDEKPSGNRRAIAYLRREQGILRKQSGPVAKQRLVASLFGLGQACQTVHDLSCATDSYEQAVAAAEPLEPNPENPDVDGLRILARLWGERKDFAKAETLMHRYIAIRERTPRRLQRHLEMDYEFAAQDFVNWHDDAEAEKLYGAAIREARSQEGAGRDPNFAFLLGRAATFFISLTRYGQAQSLLDEALLVLQSAGEVDGSAQIYANKATICKLLGDRPGAMAFLNRANQALKAAPTGVVIEPYTFEHLPTKPSLARHGI